MFLAQIFKLLTQLLLSSQLYSVNTLAIQEEPKSIYFDFELFILHYSPQNARLYSVYSPPAPGLSELAGLMRAPGLVTRLPG